MEVLVIVAHSDDEVIGCGGTIAKHVSNGDTVSLLVMTDGVSARGSSDKAELRESALSASCKNLGITEYKQLSYPDNEMDSVSLLSIVKGIEDFVENKSPQIVYTHSSKDLNVDHQLTMRAVMTAFRPQPNSSVESIYGFEVLSSTEWNTDQFHPMMFNVLENEHINRLEKSLKIYKDEMRDEPHSRSIKNIIRQREYRGSCVGHNYVEAFEVYREIKK
ncbi:MULTISPECIES: PIG-L deacetylase family protein [unclassified Halobacteriovorax]|uniref:PIG-L deacetylase family protein n=1 Tax=unclassified Halobacteriovorax TaxID=2639665 RepID=UPI003999A2DE